ncbi:hypothetical protein HYH03_018403 [Edaphochlamys debaryana]|uniref:Uncharacterized protein n=1 Tax=Edaphochlamys debaryana TaxID=47281 RepID=A0A836BN51_9CHLO|nr:hypothetical protein HYH03_018403 [Edaphochlamys debaryana]|eukprot:KAG2482665.1 hypothetical protein HYH03_018403 [Edaphochlamys debaryana]
MPAKLTMLQHARWQHRTYRKAFQRVQGAQRREREARVVLAGIKARAEKRAKLRARAERWALTAGLPKPKRPKPKQPPKVPVGSSRPASLGRVSAPRACSLVLCLLVQWLVLAGGMPTFVPAANKGGHLRVQPPVCLSPNHGLSVGTAACKPPQLPLQPAPNISPAKATGGAGSARQPPPSPGPSQAQPGPGGSQPAPGPGQAPRGPGKPPEATPVASGAGSTSPEGVRHVVKDARFAKDPKYGYTCSITSESLAQQRRRDAGAPEPPAPPPVPPSPSPLEAERPQPPAPAPKATASAVPPKPKPLSPAAAEKLRKEAVELDGQAVRRKMRDPATGDWVPRNGTVHFLGPEAAPAPFEIRYSDGSSERASSRAVRAWLLTASAHVVSVYTTAEARALPNEWRLEVPSNARHAFKQLGLDPEWDDERLQLMIADLPRGEHRALTDSCGRPPRDEAVRLLLFNVNFSRYPVILDPCAGVGALPQALRGFGYNVLANEVAGVTSKAINSHLDPFQPGTYRGWQQEQVCRAIITSPRARAADFLIPLMICFAPVVAAFVSGNFVLAAPPSRRMFLNGLQKAERLAFLTGLPRGHTAGRPGMWLVIFRDRNLRELLMRGRVSTAAPWVEV